MDPSDPPAGSCLLRLPRTRGDGPDVMDKSVLTGSASPHTRGWTREAQTAQLRERASPHTRGWTHGMPDEFVVEDGFPAHAGMDPRPCGRCSARDRLPRTRGDGPERWETANWATSASPHTRGWTVVGHPLQLGALGFPAHAGMDPSWSSRRRPRRWLPRTRGDGPSRSCTGRFWLTASPHTRGWTRAQPSARVHPSGFPAHAGMNPAAGTDTNQRARLPRARGDGPQDAPGVR